MALLGSVRPPIELLRQAPDAICQRISPATRPRIFSCCTGISKRASEAPLSLLCTLCKLYSVVLTILLCSHAFSPDCMLPALHATAAPPPKGRFVWRYLGRIACRLKNGRRADLVRQRGRDRDSSRRRKPARTPSMPARIAHNHPIAPPQSACRRPSRSELP